MKTAAVGVVGHVDHGKSALVKALTDTDPDRLKEEKARGISIVLGFAHLALPGGEIELIDTPGHERFVRPMIAGATGIDAVLLAVAANEGIRPQTIEHIDIARLIGVRHAIVAITKCDLVTPAEARRVAAEAEQLVGDMAAATTVLTSAATGEGITELAGQLETLLAHPDGRTEHGFFHLPIDRAFAIAGFGTVVTGTLRRGRISVGDEVEIMPRRLRARVRGLQVHSRPLSAAGPGQRVAVNLRGVDKADIRPGDCLATPGMLSLGRWLDAELHLLDSLPHPLESGDTVRLLLGTTEVGARLRLLGQNQLAPGSAAVVKLHCAEEIAVPAREPFIIRRPSPPHTIGGGRILDPVTTRHRRQDTVIVERLRWMSGAEPQAIVRREIQDVGWCGRSIAGLAQLLGFAPSRVASWAKAADAEIFDGLVVDSTLFDELCNRLLREIEQFHVRFPREAGMGQDRLLSTLPMRPAASVYQAALARLTRRGKLTQDRGRLRRTGIDQAHSLSSADLQTARAIEQAIREGGLTPPDVQAVIMRDSRRQWAVRYLLRGGALVRTADRVQKREILFHREAIAHARQRLAERFSGAVGFTVGDAGRVLGVSRKYSIPLLEHLDTVGFTVRRGDRRVLSMTAVSAAGAVLSVSQQ